MKKAPSTGIQCLQREDFLDERLSQEDHMQFEAHLSECDDCNQYVGTWKDIRHAYADWAAQPIAQQPAPPCRDDARLFVNNLKNKLAASPVPPSRVRNPFVFQRLVPLAAAVTIAIAAIVYLRISAQAGDTNQKVIVHPPEPSASATQSGWTQCTVWRVSKNATAKESLILKDGVSLQTESNERIIANVGIANVGNNHVGNANVGNANVGNANVGNDTIGMDKESRLAFAHIHPNKTELTLQRGIAVFDVSPRTDGNRFRVFAGDTVITVIGTRFAVERHDGNVIVGVGKGTVLVQRQNEQLKLTAGNSITVFPGQPLSDLVSPLGGEKQLLMEQLLSREPVSAMAAANSEIPEHKKRDDAEKEKNGRTRYSRELTQWRQMILAGQHSEAARQIQSYLAFVPNDGDALMLLATCQKTEKKYADAFLTYQKAIGSSNPPLANQARYLAGELAQEQLGRNEQAVDLFEGYLIHAPKASPIRGEAKFRLSRALLKTNQIDRAKKHLQEIIDEYRRTSVANRARKLLNEIP
ncbi:MAG: FecR domain-containing protein [Deltaproteobacteria bacterium]|nr:FecR domain-containing protein [Deltaproteobacteria bacterium]